MILGSIARRYARALLELATEDDLAEKVGADIGDFVATVERLPELQRTLLNPGITKGQRSQLVRTLLERVSYQQITRNFLLLLVDKGRIDHLSAMVREYGALLDAQVGRTRATVRSAAPLQDQDLAQLRGLLEKMTGKTVLLEHEVDPGLIGGVVTKVGGLVFDGSLKTQLGRIHERLSREMA